MDNSPVLMEKPDDLTLQECQEANFDLIMTLANQALWHICEEIFGYLNYETVEDCRKVSELWNESLERIALIKFLQEFGDRDIENTNEKVSAIVAGWKKAVKEYGFQASLEDIQGVKGSLQNLLRGNGKCCKYPVHEAAKIGAVKLMEFILRTSFDMSAKDYYGWTAWYWACYNGQTETAQLLVQSSKDFGIDMNTKGDYGRTAWHWACRNGKTETAQLLIQYSEEFGIDLNATYNNGRTAWHDACYYGQTETVQLLIQSSKDFGIDLNAKNSYGWTAWHLACRCARTETVQMILKNWKEFGIDIKAQDNQGQTALDLIRYYEGEIWNQIKNMLE